MTVQSCDFSPSSSVEHSTVSQRLSACKHCILWVKSGLMYLLEKFDLMLTFARAKVSSLRQRHHLIFSAASFPVTLK